MSGRAEPRPPAKLGLLLAFPAADRRFLHLAGAQAAGADAQAADSAVHHRAHALEVRFKPPRRHVVRVADISPDDRALSAEFAAFRHKEEPWEGVKR